MFRFLVFSDLHAHTHKRYARVSEEGINTRLKVALDVLAYIRTLAVEQGITHILFAGDLFETKGRVPIVVINHVLREFQRWVGRGLEVVMIPGNHDYAIRSGREHALEIFSELEGFTVMGREGYLNEIPGVGILYIQAVPFADEMKEEWFVRHPFGVDADLALCLAHGILENAMFTPGIGVASIPEASRPETIKRAWLEPYDLSIIGHVHYPGYEVTDGQHFLIPGQPWHQHSYENAQKRGVWLVEIEPGGKPTLTLFEPPTPLFLHAQLEESGEVVLFGGTNVEGNIVSLQPMHATIPEATIHQARRQLEQKGATYVEVLPPEGAGTSADGHAPRLALDPYADPATVLGVVLRSGLVDLGGFDPDDLTALGLDLIKTAQVEED